MSEAGGMEQDQDAASLAAAEADRLRTEFYKELKQLHLRFGEEKLEVLAGRAGVSKGYLSSLFNGTRAGLPGHDLLIQIVKAVLFEQPRDQIAQEVDAWRERRVRARTAELAADRTITSHHQKAAIAAADLVGQARAEAAAIRAEAEHLRQEAQEAQHRAANLVAEAHAEAAVIRAEAEQLRQAARKGLDTDGDANSVAEAHAERMTAEFFDALQRLYIRAGEPALRTVAARNNNLLSPSILAALLRDKPPVFPNYDVMTATVEALLHDRPAADSARELEQWRERWREARYAIRQAQEAKAQRASQAADLIADAHTEASRILAEAQTEAAGIRAEAREETSRTEQYMQAAGLAGDSEAAVRLTLVHGLTRIADDSERARPTYLEVLCAYLRMPYDPHDPETDPAEYEVRTTVQDALAERLRPRHPGFWPDARVDLTGAYLIDLDFRGITVREFTADGATFSGATRFDRATFSGATRFDRATFSGGAWFGEATFSEDVVFFDATFSEDAFFGAVTFNQTAWFSGATFSGAARFSGATFSGATRFDRATFSGATRFSGAMFSGVAGFTRATFRRGHPPVWPDGFAEPAGIVWVDLPALDPGSSRVSGPDPGLPPDPLDSPFVLAPQEAAKLRADLGARDTTLEVPAFAPAQTPSFNVVRRGYDPEQVREYLARPPEERPSPRFDLVRHGYDQGQVNVYLREEALYLRKM